MKTLYLALVTIWISSAHGSLAVRKNPLPSSFSDKTVRLDAGSLSIIHKEMGQSTGQIKGAPFFLTMECRQVKGKAVCAPVSFEGVESKTKNL